MAHANASSARIRDAWSEAFVDRFASAHLESVKGRARALDFGCGHFETGERLLRYFDRVDGYDVDPGATLAARRAAAPHGNRAFVFDSDDEVPHGAYDLVVVCSVVQYFPDLDTFRDLLRRCRHWVGADGCVVVADLIPREYSPARDAVDSIRHAIRGRFLGAMTEHIARAAWKGNPGSFLKVAAHDAAHLATLAGFKVTQAPENLTPSTQRYSLLLSPG